MSIFGKAKPEPKPLPAPYAGPKGPTVCAEVSHARGSDYLHLPCPACGHAVHYRHLCGFCQIEVRLQALETTKHPGSHFYDSEAERNASTIGRPPGTVAVVAGRASMWDGAKWVDGP